MSDSKGVILTVRYWLWAILIASLAVRPAFFNFVSGDYEQWIRRWCEFFIEHGAWRGIGELTPQITNYPPFYMYLVSLSTLLPLPQLYSIKLFSIAADYVAALYFWRILRLYGRSAETAVISVAVLLFLPTVIMNGAQWAQCDMMYTAALVASFYYFVANRPLAAMLAFGISCSLKPQAIFWCPVLAALFVTGRLPWRYLWVPAAVYIVSCVPSIAAGRPAREVLLHWTRIRYKRGLSFHAPNWYQWVTWDNVKEYQTYFSAGIWLAGILSLGLILLAWKTSGVAKEPSKWAIMTAMASVLFLPFFLPKMHERYFFAADVFAVLYAFLVPSGWVVPILLQMASTMSYSWFLFRWGAAPFKLMPIFTLVAILWVGKDLVLFLRRRSAAVDT